MDYVRRILPIEKELKAKSLLLLGPRRTGKSALLRHQLKVDRTYDLLKADVFQSLAARPSLIRESLRTSDKIVVIDEIQKLPILMDEVHSMIEETSVRFVLTGSSARKLKRSETSLMAGRARILRLHPFCHAEVSDRFDLNRYLHLGGLPPVYLQSDASEAWQELRDYTGLYIKEEIMAEALVRKVDAFSRFLPVAARMNSELLNFEAIASDSQVPARTVREYYALVEDTLLGSTLNPLRFKGAKSRKAIATSKFYFFDTGVLNALTGRKTLSDSGSEYGSLFETWVHNEIKTYLDHKRSDSSLQFWRSSTGQEVDFVIDEEIGIEVKATHNVTEKHLSGLEALDGISKLKKKFVVSRDPVRRTIGKVTVLPWQNFVQELWSGQLL